MFFQSEEVGTDSVRQPTEAALILRQKANGVRDLVARVITRDRAGNNRYVRLRSLHVESPDQVRIALHDERIWFLYSESGSADVHVVAEYPVPESLSAANVMLSASANGNGRVTEVTWRRFSAYGDPGQQEPSAIQ